MPRVILNREFNRDVPELIGGKVFVPLTVDGKAVRASEQLSQPEAERLLGIPGYSPFRGDAELTGVVEKAIEVFKSRDVGAALAQNGDKNAEIRGLQDNLVRTSDELSRANQRIVELEEDNVQLRKQIGEPSLSWSRQALAKAAESYGLPITTQMTKQEILAILETHVTERG